MCTHFLKKNGVVSLRLEESKRKRTYIDLLFLKKLDRLLPTVTYVAIIGTIRAFDVFWLMMVRAFQGVLCVNKPIYMVCYKALCDVGQFYLLFNSL